MTKETEVADGDQKPSDSWEIVSDSEWWYPSVIAGKHASGFWITFSHNWVYLTASKHKNQVTKITTKAPIKGLNSRVKQAKCLTAK